MLLLFILFFIFFFCFFLFLILFELAKANNSKTKYFCFFCFSRPGWSRLPSAGIGLALAGAGWSRLAWAAKAKIITPWQNDPQQLRFLTLREFWIHSFECISLGMPCQYPPRPKVKACQGSCATVQYSRQLELEGPWEGNVPHFAHFGYP